MARFKLKKLTPVKLCFRKRMEPQCRACLRVSSRISRDIFAENLPLKLKEIAAVEIMEDEGLPSKICDECARNVHLFYDFRNVVRKSDEVLREQSSKFASDGEVKFESDEESSLLTQEVDLKNEELEETNEEEFQDETLATLDALFSDEVDIKDTESDFTDGVVVVRVEDSVVNSTKKEEPRYKCQQCDFTCFAKNLWRNHQHSHKRKVIKICSVCGKSLRDENFSRHMLSHGGPTVTCKICGKTVKNVVSLRSHMYSHSSPLQCNICGKVYKYPPHFYAHRKRHALGDKKTVKCDVCGKLFFNKQMLPKHMQVHTGERPYPCEFCKKGFSSSYALKTHRRQHTNEKPFACEHCDMAFPQRVSLKTHLKSKHPDKII